MQYDITHYNNMLDQPWRGLWYWLNYPLECFINRFISSSSVYLIREPLRPSRSHKRRILPLSVRYHKPFIMLSLRPSTQAYKEGGCRVPHILNVGSKCVWVVGFKLRPSLLTVFIVPKCRSGRHDWNKYHSYREQRLGPLAVCHWLTTQVLVTSFQK